MTSGRASVAAGWHPPRDPFAPRPVLEEWRVRLEIANGRARRQTLAELELVKSGLEDQARLTDSELRRRLAEVSHQFRYACAPYEANRIRRGQMRALRARLLGLWAIASQRVLGMRPHDTQVIAALEMHNGHLVQLSPGEGKTLAIGMTAALYAAARRPCHVVTANDYLASRDADLLRPLLQMAGFTTVAVTAETPPPMLGACYAQDVVYATGKQLLADFLRDNLVVGGDKRPTHRLLWEMQRGPADRQPVGRGLWAAIVDEADSVLIDEATTPLIISSADDNPMLVEAVLAGKQIFESLRQEEDYVVRTEPVPDVRFTAAGKQRIDEMSFLLPAFWRFPERAQGVVSLSVMARHVYRRDRHYLVDDEGKVVIVDEATGRVMAGRSWSHGIHQAIEAMEGLELSSPPKTVARMTFQNFFKRYHRLCGASGTLQGIERELRRSYGLAVVPVAPRVPSRLRHEGLRVFVDPDSRFAAVVEEIRRSLESGTPVLVGTRKIADTERLSQALTQAGLEHSVLNAKHHAQEARIVERAGAVGAVTVSTNMAGRGTDILLGPGAAEAGGLRVLMFEPHDARRIEEQLYGRAGRQGAPGSAVGFLCLKDETLQRSMGAVHATASTLLLPLVLHPRAAAWLVRIAQMLLQSKAAAQRRRLAERESKVAGQLSFSE
jgi:preprotein translocase subunit SecA